MKKLVAPNDVINNEEDVKREIKKELDRYGWFWWSPSANMYGRSGQSDIMALKHHVFLAIEAKFFRPSKAEASKPTAMQRAFLVSVDAEGGIALLVDQRNIRDYRAFMSAYDQSVRAESHGSRAPAEIGATLLNSLQILTRFQ